MTQHHPSDATLMAYVAGTLPAPHAIVVRAHLAVCHTCRAAARLAIDLGGAIIEDAPPTALGADALEGTLARLAAPAPVEPPARVPVTLADFATGRWWWIGKGIHLMPLMPRDRHDARLDLIRVAPGTSLPAHGHTGSEMTCVLAGAFADKTGEYGVGDFAESDPTLDHQPTASAASGDCVCLIATTGRLRADSRLIRLILPTVGL
jgi:putative transcriptional regulator